MAKNGSATKRMRTGRSLNLVLWFTFSVFALIVISVYAIAQNALVNKKYRDRATEIIVEAGERIAEIVSDPVSNDADFSRRAQESYGKANSYGLQLYLIYEDGESVFPEYTEKKSYPEKAEFLKRKLSGEEAQTFTDKAEISYGKAVTIDGERCFLYLSTTSHWLDEGVNHLRSVSLLTGLVALVLAFIVSGFVALLITKPVSEVTERAKELARGNYNLDFKKDYFCAEITELSDALEYARGEISKADQMQKELIANVSHDFKTPLTMIKAYASMIREISGEDKEKRDANAQVIIDESDRLTALVGDLLDLSKIRAGLDSDERSVFNLSDEVYRVASRFDYLKETSGYEIQTEIEDDIYTLAGRGRIEQVLYNLIGNAVNYTGEDKLVRIKLYSKAGGSRFEVVDTGKGISPEEIDTVWDRYYRSGKTHKRPVQGTGLGLSIVKSILVVQGCPFGIDSEEGKGSCFWVEFPPPEEARETEKQEKKEKKKKVKRREK